MADPASLRERLIASADPVFAVVDGAQFADLPMALFDADLASRPLYRNDSVGVQDRVRTTPQMVRLDRLRDTARLVPTDDLADDEGGGRVSPAVLDRLLSVVGATPGVVFWVSPMGEGALYRHLRGLNMVYIPQGVDVDPDEVEEAEEPTTATAEGVELAETSAEEPKVGGEETHELVLFRHADANVLGQTLGALAEPQLARFMGPASEVIFAPDTEWADGPVSVLRPSDIHPPSGPLRLDQTVMQHIEGRQITARHRIIADYIEESAPEYMDGRDRSDIMAAVLRADETAPSLGFQTDRGLGMWALILFITDGAAEHDRDIRRALTHSSLSADEALEEMMAQVARAPADHPMWQVT